MNKFYSISLHTLFEYFRWYSQQYTKEFFHVKSEDTEQEHIFRIVNLLQVYIYKYTRCPMR